MSARRSRRSVWDIRHDHIRETVTLTMPYEAAEFIAIEMPGNDVFTRDWHRLVWDPIIEASRAENVEEET